MDDARSRPSRPEDGADRSERACALMRELEVLRRLAAQLQKRATAGDAHALRAILARREAVLDSIRGLMNELQAAEAGKETRDGAFGAVLDEVVAADAASQRLLKTHADKTAEDIHRLRAGRKWRQGGL